MDLAEDECELVRRYRAMPRHQRPPYLRLGMRLLNDVPRVRAEYLFWDEIKSADARRVAAKR